MVKIYNKMKNSKGEEVFGCIQGYSYMQGKRGEIILPKGEIYLYEGDKYSFGAEHIWMRHGHELQRNGFESAERYVESIIQTGAEVYCEQHFPRLKPLILKRPDGVVVLEYRQTPFIHYSVVTAYSANLRNRIGNKIGNY